MFTETLFPSFDEPPTPPHRTGQRSRSSEFNRRDNLFLALVPDEDTGTQIDRLARRLTDRHGLSQRLLGASRYHVSLHSLGGCFEISAELVSDLGKIFAPVAAAVPSFRVTVDRALTFKNKGIKQPFVLREGSDNPALMYFYQALGSILPGRTRPKFTPHITLLYDVKIVEEHFIEPLTWTVNELVLVRSLVGRGCHIRLARWPLHGR